MSWIGDRLRVLRGRFGVGTSADEVETEIAHHIAMRTEENLARGMAPDAARREALRRFGDVDAYRSATVRLHGQTRRRMRLAGALDAVRRETGQAARGLLRAPAFAAIAILTLGVGIGGSAAVYTLLESVVLRPLPYPDDDRLVRIRHPVPGMNAEWRWDLSVAGYFSIAGGARTLESVALALPASPTLIDGQAERVRAAAVTASLFDLLGGRPALGRLIGPADDAPGAAAVVVLGHAYWTRRYGADPAVLGRTVEIESMPYAIVGIAAPGFDLPGAPTDVWLALRLDAAAPPANSHFLPAYARLAPGIEPAVAEAELARLVAGWADAFPSAYGGGFIESAGFAVEVTPLRDDVVGGLSRVLWILMGAVLLVFAIACIDVANLFLVRAESRRREGAVRAALGASRGRLAGNALAEGLLIAVPAGALGVALAVGATRLLAALAPDGLPRIDEVAVGGGALLVTLATVLAAASLFALLPLLGSPPATEVLREGGRGTTPSRRRQLVRGTLVVAQVALALVLLASAGLLVRTMRALQAVDPGFRTDDTVAVDIALSAGRYPLDADAARFHRSLVERLAASPGVTAVGVTTMLPFGGAACGLVFAEGQPTLDTSLRPCPLTVRASPGADAALGLRVTGRWHTWDDLDRGFGAVVITRALADRLWPGEDPLGRGLRGNGYGEPFYRVVGIVEGLRAEHLDRGPTEIAYFPLLPLEGSPLWLPPRAATVVVHAPTVATATRVELVRRGVRELDAAVPIGRVTTLEGIVAASTSHRRFALVLLGTAAAVALLLATVGVYGVIAYVVDRRRAEIGVRMALGAPAALVRRQVVAASLRLATVGVVLGLAGALAVTRVLDALLFGVAPTDATTLAAAALLLLATAALAAWLPATRAARTDPLEALRAE